MLVRVRVRVSGWCGELGYELSLQLELKLELELGLGLGFRVGVRIEVRDQGLYIYMCVCARARSNTVPMFPQYECLEFWFRILHVSFSL